MNAFIHFSRRGKWLNLQPDLPPTQTEVAKAKKDDVIKLLELISAPPYIND